MTQPPEDALLSLLEAERAALLSGDLSTLEASAERKTELAIAISRHAPPLPRERIAALSAAAQRNAELCEAARRGLRTAIDRLSERARVASHLETYGADGRRHRHGGGPRSLEKRS